MAGLPPPPSNDPPGSFAWVEWYRLLRNYISSASSIPWNVIQFAGSNITDIAIRLHNSLQSIQGGQSGEYYHLTAAQSTALSTFAYRAITALRTLDSTDEVVDCTANTFTVTLPTAVGFVKSYTIKNSGTGVITVATTSSQTIDGNLTVSLNQYDSITVRSTNTNWILI